MRRPAAEVDQTLMTGCSSPLAIRTTAYDPLSETPPETSADIAPPSTLRHTQTRRRWRVDSPKVR